MSAKPVTVYYLQPERVTAAKRTALSPYQQTASGYGSKLRTSYMVQIDGGWRWHRVYVIQYSNAGSCYVLLDGQRLFIDNETDLRRRMLRRCNMADYLAASRILARAYSELTFTEGWQHSEGKRLLLSVQLYLNRREW